MKNIAFSMLTLGVFLLHAHLVFVTKYRKKILTKELISYMQYSLENICKNIQVVLKEFNGEKDHVHLLVSYSPKISISQLVNTLKGVSSRLLRKKFKEIRKCFWKSLFWSPSYFVGSCGGAPLEKIKQYIQNQDSPEY